MKFKYVFVLAFFFAASTLPGYAQNSWKQPETARAAAAKTNAAVAFQMMLITNKMLQANAYATTNPFLAVTKAEEAANDAKQLAAETGGPSDIQKVMNDLINSILTFLRNLQDAKRQMYAM